MVFLRKLVKGILALSTVLVVSFTSAHTASAKTVIEAGKEHLGTPYKFGGTTPDGFDCSGFTNYVMTQFGVELPRSAAEIYNVGTSVKKDDLQVGDLVFFETYKKGASHLGIYAGEGKFIHSSTSSGVIFSSINDPYYWGPRYLGAKRVFNNTYADVDNKHFAYSQIRDLSAKGLLSGFDNEFRPNDKISRLQAVSVVAKAINLNASNGSAVINDVDKANYAYNSIAAMQEAGIITLDENGNFNPTTNFKKANLAILFTKAFNLKVKDNNKTFVDTDSSHYAIDAMKAVATNSIMTADNSGAFNPDQEVTRAEFALYLSRALAQK